MITRAEHTESLLSLSHELGAEPRKLAILGEGNTSAKLSADTFLVKASGSCLETLSEGNLVECHFAPLLAMLDRAEISEQEIEDALLASRVDPAARKPSVEALFHAWLLTLDGVAWVGHTHPISVNQILCSGRGIDFALRRLFPDQIVCCGLASVHIPYTDPGLQLARAIRGGVLLHIRVHGAPPRVIQLENHGLIALGPSPQAVQAATFMADKSAQIFAGAAALGGPVFLEPVQAARIANRLDEHYRQRALKI
jgi:rhamnose utilization protein RhaD (predicted bifunctional aldolase and dehydrogenase)